MNGKDLIRAGVGALVAYFVAMILRVLGAGKFVTHALSGAAGSLVAAYAL